MAEEKQGFESERGKDTEKQVMINALRDLAKKQKIFERSMMLRAMFLLFTC